MKLSYKSAKITYKTLFIYGLIVIALLLVAAPVFANSRSGGHLLDFSLASETGHTFQSARSLARGMNVDHLRPGQEMWYTYSTDSLEDRSLSWISLALRFESEARIEPEQVNFQVLAQPEAASWLSQPVPPDQVLGQGLRSPLVSDDNTVESFWTGQVDEQEQYYVRVFNTSPFALDYTLEVKAEQPAVSGAMPAGLNLKSSQPASLNARQAGWALTAQAVERMTAEEAAAWMQNAQAVGWIVTEGTAEAPDPGRADAHLLWQLVAQAIAGKEAAASTQWLVQADTLGWLAVPFGAEAARPAAVDDTGSESNSLPAAVPAPSQTSYSPVNIYPNNPLEFNFKQVNSGRLGPYGEHWYSLLRDDLDKDLVEDMELTMFFTPREGYVSDRVNFELFPASQYHIWGRGDTDYMENFGLGLWVSRDEDPNTGERLWSGSLVDGNRYLVKVKNGTSSVIDYYLFPGDIENAELGNPTLHRSDEATGYVPYSLSPPTRPGPPLAAEND